ncbi:hypothetical protein [Bradyrhizobium niftali]|jgi:hypothetical protein|uniref:Uncharacterized protein n=1 Tax=Bradyrhizobium niftali TaxID=2560055 RepID=A0A4Y9M279_9BRAD|nr:hypothetical protein [Bradyrhizobium niftali]TFV49236.1 hypothetical protein E4K65_10000 [Bradyrhizobium niftali]
MTDTHDANSKDKAIEDTAQSAVSQMSSTSDKDALGDSSLDDVSGGAWSFSNAAAASYSSNGQTG